MQTRPPPIASSCLTGSDLKHGFRLGPWEVHPLTGEIKGAAATLRIEPKVMEVLLVLAQRSGEVVERYEILRRIWASRAGVSDEPLTRCIAVLRRALNDSPQMPVYIQTIPKRGYRLLASVMTLVTVDARRRHISSRELGHTLAVREESVPANSIAVLPFSGGSASAEILDFCGNVAAAIRSRLMSGENALVVARTWSEAVDGSRDLPAIRAQLRVARVLEGRVQGNGNQLRIHIDLCDARTGYLIWSESFEGSLKTASCFALQDRIANAIAAKLRASSPANAPRRAASHDIQKILAATSGLPQDRRLRRAEYRDRPNRPNARIES